MHRGFKLGLYGLVVAGLIAGSLAWAAGGKTVTLRVDGKDRHVHTSADSVRGVLADAGVTVGSHDIVAPDLAAHVKDGSEIVLRRGHLLHLSVDGKQRDVWVNADSVDQALDQLGYDSRNVLSVSRATRLDSSVTSIAIDSPKRVTFRVDGRTRPVVTAGPTIFQAISDAKVYVGPSDRIVVAGRVAAGTQAVKNGEVIAIQRVRYGSSVEASAVPFQTVKQADPSSYVGTDAVVRAGRAGRQQTTYQLVYVDGKLAGKTAKKHVLLTAPVSQVLRVGSKPVPAASSSTSAAAAQQIAAGMVSARGWGSDQFGCLVSLWSKESGWRTDAANPSGAYGIPQALPGSKMATAGADWQTNAATQITWGLNYIAGVYGTPCAAWGHSQATNWY